MGLIILAKLLHFLNLAGKLLSERLLQRLQCQRLLAAFPPCLCEMVAATDLGLGRVAAQASVSGALHRRLRGERGAENRAP